MNLKKSVYAYTAPQFWDQIKALEIWNHTLWNSTDEGAGSASLFSIPRKNTDLQSDLFLRLWYLDICFGEEWSPVIEDWSFEEIENLHRYLHEDLQSSQFKQAEATEWSPETSWILQMIKDRIKINNEFRDVPSEVHYLNRPGVYFNEKQVSLDFTPAFSSIETLWIVSLTPGDTRLFGLTSNNALLFQWGTSA